MEDDVKDDSAKVSEPKFAGKAGWLKKSSGKLLGSYKDRYIQLNRTEMEVYENEDLKNCVERLDLENYEKCDELRSAFKKKNRLILIRVPKSGNKVCDVKLQAATQEEREAWITALSDAINRAKNKIFDEVKVDESLSLEHVTRSRPKGNRGRRPPTRIHMKEASNLSPDGVLRLDPDAVDNTPNGTHYLGANEDELKSQVFPSKSLDDISEEATSEDSAPPKKVVKPPMPPTKEKKSSESLENETKPEESASQKKIVVPPMPPSKDKKPDLNTEGEKSSNDTQEKKVLKPPIPPSKDSKPRIFSDTTEDNSSEDEDPQSKSRTDQEESSESALHSLRMSDHDNEDGENRDVSEEDKENEMVTIISNNVLKTQGVMWNSPSLLEEESSGDHGANKSAILDSSLNGMTTLTLEPPVREFALKKTPQSTPEVAKKSAGPPALPKKKPIKKPAKLKDHMVTDSATASSDETISEESKAPSSDHKEEPGIVILSLSNSGGSQESEDKCAMDSDKKSLDSGQISAEESESSEQVSPSTDRLQSSLEVLDIVTSEEELEMSDKKVQSLVVAAVQTVTCSTQASSGTESPKTPSKKKASSMGDLLDIQAEPQVCDIKVLQSEVSLELEETGELLSKIAAKEFQEGQSGAEEIQDPESLLTTAMEKLRKAEQYLQEAKSFKDQENKSNRASW